MTREVSQAEFDYIVRVAREVRDELDAGKRPLNMEDLGVRLSQSEIVAGTFEGMYDHLKDPKYPDKRAIIMAAIAVTFEIGLRTGERLYMERKGARA